MGEIQQRQDLLKPPLTIWYNTLCPICHAGVTWQKRLLLPLVQSGQIAFENINDQPMALSDHGVIDIELIRKRLHATTPDGGLLIGADVVIAIMQFSHWQRWLAAILKAKPIRPLAHHVYDGFAEWLYRWNRRKNRW